MLAIKGFHTWDDYLYVWQSTAIFGFVPMRSTLRNDSTQHIRQSGSDRPGTLSRTITATQLELKRVFTTEGSAKLTQLIAQ